MTSKEALLYRLGATADWRVTDRQPSPWERLLRAIFGEPVSGLRDTPECHNIVRIPIPPNSEELVERSLEGNSRLVLDTLPPRERQVLVLRFGLEDGQSRTFEEVGHEFGVTRERIRQLEAKALRKLRHPSRSRQLKPFLYPLTDLDTRVLQAREELYDNLSRLYPKGMAEQVVRNIKRRHLTEAFRSVESALRFSCGVKINYCLGCGKPLPPGWTLCDRHCRRLWKTLTLVCDGCGREFLRREAELFSRRGEERVAHRRTFCCWACRRGKDGAGLPCQTCGRPKVNFRQLRESSAAP